MTWGFSKTWIFEMSGLMASWVSESYELAPDRCSEALHASVVLELLGQ